MSIKYANMHFLLMNHFRVKKEDRKERETNVDASKLNSLSKDEKYIKSLKKKLKAINNLLEKQKEAESRGEEFVFDAQQQAKVDTLGETMENMQAMLEAANT